MASLLGLRLLTLGCVFLVSWGQLQLRSNIHNPKCPVEYYDTTGGKAYWWGCAKGCPGGSYADKNCGCACQLVTSRTSTTSTSTVTTTTTSSSTSLRAGRPPTTTAVTRAASEAIGVPTTATVLGQMTAAPSSTTSTSSALPVDAVAVASTKESGAAEQGAESSPPLRHAVVGMVAATGFICAMITAIKGLHFAVYRRRLSQRSTSETPVKEFHASNSLDSDNAAWRDIVKNRPTIQLRPPFYGVKPQTPQASQIKQAPRPPKSAEPTLSVCSILQLGEKHMQPAYGSSPRVSEVSTCPPSAPSSEQSEVPAMLTPSWTRKWYSATDTSIEGTGHECLARDRDSAPHQSARGDRTTWRARSTSPRPSPAVAVRTERRRNTICLDEVAQRSLHLPGCVDN